MNRGISRRSLFTQLVALALGAAGLLVVRNHVAWPKPKVSFAKDRWSGWFDLPARGGLIELPALVRGQPVRAVVDSGAQYSAIDAGLAERLALPAATPIPIVAFGVSGAPSLTRTVSLDADLGAFRLTGLRAAALNLQPLSALTRQPFAMLLGRDFLHAVTLEADFPRARAAFFAPDAWTPPAAATPAAARSQAGALMVAVTVEDAPPVEVMLDTGATGALALSEETAQAAGLLDGRPLRRGQSVTLGGVGEDGMALARRIAFAGHVLEDVEVQIYHPAANAPVPAGLLGMGVLKRFHLALDLTGGRLFLIAAAGRQRATAGNGHRLRRPPRADTWL